VSDQQVRGQWYEDLEPGTVFHHAIRRTITESDNVLFCALTMNPQPLHIDEHFAASTEYGQRIVNSLFTLGLVVGLTVYDLTIGTTLGNLGLEATEFPAPVRHGDTLRAETEIVAARPSRSRPNAGIVTFVHSGFRQDDVLVVRCRRNGLMLRRPTDGRY
jgi:acyl dehydratase